jgi:hypothetical protein
MRAVTRPVGSQPVDRRYRRYDIDRLISRTLACAILTVLLVGSVGLVALTTDMLVSRGASEEPPPPSPRLPASSTAVSTARPLTPKRPLPHSQRACATPCRSTQSAPLIAGWIVTEVGRQPWVVYHVILGHDTLVAVIVAVIAGAVILFPSLALLFRLVLGGTLDAHAAPRDRDAVTVGAADRRLTAQARDGGGLGPQPAPPRSTRKPRQAGLLVLPLDKTTSASADRHSRGG